MWRGFLAVKQLLFEALDRQLQAEAGIPHGYYVLLPDLFYRAGPYETPQFSMFQDPVKRQEWGARFASTASQANVMRDTRAFLDFLSAQPEVKQPAGGKISSLRILAEHERFPFWLRVDGYWLMDGERPGRSVPEPSTLNPQPSTCSSSTPSTSARSPWARSQF